MNKKIFVANEADMLKLAAACSERTLLGTVIFLYGELGAGKTTWARGFLRGLGYEHKVKSPTYTLVESYQCVKGLVYHFDLYRVSQLDELEHLGLTDYFGADAICLVEWPEHGQGRLPLPDLSCYIEPHDLGRLVTFKASTPHGERILEDI